ncbi:hypothetical protein GCM10010441_39680 [Kitasatospora paracochleata]|uniref:Uncharacterized protein n=1 Tax=Kitasatospora paracochleata TaxID=58354 RepID=A0ABT1IW07_9ACTN|nr:hypothetical protein [Kitasatospora paracochleata]MCP2309312.1 hypothetical protein [Kitasatospora paracochleata]
MPYRLQITADQQHAWDQLLQAASEQLTLALARVIDDPYGTTEPYDSDDQDDVMRQLVLSDLVTALLVVDATKTVRIMQIIYLG